MTAASPSRPSPWPDERPVPEAVLYRAALAAVESVEGCVAAAVCVWSGPHLLRAGSSHSAAARLIEHQADTGQGPAVETARSGRAATVPDVRRERRWPAFTALMTRFGLSSVTVVPRSLTGGRTLTLSLCALRPGELRPGHTAVLLTEVAAARLQQASLAAQGDDLRAALATREPIEQAKGMIMQALGCAADEAFEQLRRYSQRRGVRLAELARMLVDDAEGAGSRSTPGLRRGEGRAVVTSWTGKARRHAPARDAGQCRRGRKEWTGWFLCERPDAAGKGRRRPAGT